MKKLLFLLVTVGAFLMGCSKQEDMSSPPAAVPNKAASTNATTNTNK